MQTVKFVRWQDGDTWIGYLQDYPDYWNAETHKRQRPFRQQRHCSQARLAQIPPYPNPPIERLIHNRSAVESVRPQRLFVPALRTTGRTPMIGIFDLLHVLLD